MIGTNFFADLLKQIDVIGLVARYWVTNLKYVSSVCNTQDFQKNETLTIRD